MEIQTLKSKNHENSNGNKNEPSVEVHSCLIMNGEQINVTDIKHDEYSDIKYPTNYVETLMHLFKGNIGPCLFAIGDAYKNSGVVLGSLLILLLELTCLHCQHLLIDASNNIKQSLNMHRNPDFATTVELCFATSSPKLQKLAPYMRKTINLFLCLTQLGCCCIYFIFISTNLKQIMDYYNLEYSIQWHMAFILIPILLSCVVRNLKNITPLSTFANICMIFGIVITFYYTCQKPFQVVENIANLEQLPLFFGTVLYGFEGICLVLPLQNKMKKPKQFSSPLGILNVCITAVIFLTVLIGLFSYLHYGSEIQGSVTLNFPKKDILAQIVKIMISLGVLLSFALQFYIPIEIMFPTVQKHLGPFRRPALAETIFRITFVLITFTLAEIVPFLDLFISLIGSFGSTIIALIFPPLLEIVTKFSISKLKTWIIIKNSIIIGIGLLGGVTGTYENIRLIIRAVKESQS